MTSLASIARTTAAILLSLVLLAPVLLHAQGGTGNTGGGTGNTGGGTGNTGGGTGNTGSGVTTLQNPLKFDSLEELLTGILDAVVNLGFIFLILMLVFVGFKFVMAQGNEEQLKSARGALMWTVIGGMLLLGAKAISLVIQDTVRSLQ